jgi:hypothetical protein
MASPNYTNDFKRLPFNQTQEESIAQVNHHQIKFYSWECVSLKIFNRTVDFVINNEEEMLIFLEAITKLVGANRRVESKASLSLKRRLTPILVTIFLIHHYLGSHSDGIYRFEGIQRDAGQDEDFLSCQQEADLDLGALHERNMLNL